MTENRVDDSSFKVMTKMAKHQRVPTSDDLVSSECQQPYGTKEWCYWAVPYAMPPISERHKRFGNALNFVSYVIVTTAPTLCT